MRVIRNDNLSMAFSMSDIRAAVGALNSYKITGLKTDKGVAAYHIQQACEKMIKLQIYSHVKKVDNREMFTHNLVRLVNYAKKCGITLIVPLSNEALVRITSWEAQGRYDLRFSIRIDTLTKYLNITKDWYMTLQKLGYR